MWLTLWIETRQLFEMFSILLLLKDEESRHGTAVLFWKFSFFFVSSWVVAEQSCSLCSTQLPVESKEHWTNEHSSHTWILIFKKKMGEINTTFTTKKICLQSGPWAESSTSLCPRGVHRVLQQQFYGALQRALWRHGQKEPSLDLYKKDSVEQQSESDLSSIVSSNVQKNDQCTVRGH